MDGLIRKENFKHNSETDGKPVELLSERGDVIRGRGFY